ncbi:uncharacterized protein LY89DRAFT_675780 [Mollisia scopiformis]|uniref:2EXR domain-containing protein n=1 Tax=Mollisia scopiformis TaxID=149040 RepID=A0A132BB46_MOLSC|nr:uncharacterized protein LY89DRAFT_675780 [Mollisia scopiformis]KUJ09611.1 hypothetical protein LY89DRAFT_675780 [Mollisia scopiformis]
MSCSSSSSDNTIVLQSKDTFHQFSRLPLELQRQIWDSTLEPRILTAYESRTLPNRSPPTTCFTKVWNLVPFPTSPEVGIYTVAEGIWPPLRPTPFWAMPYFRQLISDQIIKNNRREKYPADLLMRFEYDTKRPAGPVALRVCKESRKVALLHYQLGFGGWHRCPNKTFSQAFEESGLRERRVWIDFERDTILIQVLQLPQNALPQNADHVRDTAKAYKQLRNLAVVAGRCWTGRGTVRSDVQHIMPWDECLLVTLQQLEKLENLVVYYYRDDQESVLAGTPFNEQVKKTILEVIADPWASFPVGTKILPLLKPPNVKMVMLEATLEYMKSY